MSRPGEFSHGRQGTTSLACQVQGKLDKKEWAQLTLAYRLWRAAMEEGAQISHGFSGIVWPCGGQPWKKWVHLACLRSSGPSKTWGSQPGRKGTASQIWHLGNSHPWGVQPQKRGQSFQAWKRLVQFTWPPTTRGGLSWEAKCGRGGSSSTSLICHGLYYSGQGSHRRGGTASQAWQTLGSLSEEQALIFQASRP